MKRKKKKVEHSGQLTYRAVPHRGFSPPLWFPRSTLSSSGELFLDRPYRGVRFVVCIVFSRFFTCVGGGGKIGHIDRACGTVGFIYFCLWFFEDCGLSFFSLSLDVGQVFLGSSVYFLPVGKFLSLRRSLWELVQILDERILANSGIEWIIIVILQISDWKNSQDFTVSY